MKANYYKTILWDCDGVILNSNEIKTEAFYNIGLAFGEDEAEQLVLYHKQNGGLPREQKFNYFINEIIKQKQSKDELLPLMLKEYGAAVSTQLRTCTVNSDIYRLKSLFCSSNWAVVSGGNQKELRSIFKERELIELFDLGIFGSPKTKHQIFNDLIEAGSIKFPALYIGDSEYDFKVAVDFGLEFRFLLQWTEFRNWQKYSGDKRFIAIQSLNDLLFKL